MTELATTELARYLAKRHQVEHYFDRTAVQAWARLTSAAPVSGVRATVRAGRERMRATLLGWLPADLRGARVLDAGCGTGALAVEAARRGAEVVAVDLSPTLIALARERLPADLAAGGGAGRLRFVAGDLLDPALGRFDHVVSMDCLIHYELPDAVRVLDTLAQRTRHSLAFTFAPRTPLLMAMMATGRLFPRADRSPAIVPVARRHLAAQLQACAGLAGWHGAREQRVNTAFYKSHAFELLRNS